MHLYTQLSALAIVTIFVLWYFTSLIKWLRPTFEGEDGKASSKRITGFVLTASGIFMVFTDKMTNIYAVYTLAILLLTGAVYAMVITVAQLIMAAKILKGHKIEEEIPSGEYKVKIQKDEE